MANQQAELTVADIDRVGRAIAARTGLVFSSGRQAELVQSLRDGFLESGEYDSFESYLAHLEQDSLNKKDMRRLIARLTVGETYFFRSKAQFELLRHEIIPRLVARRAKTTKVLRLWSAGCSTGEEAYSLAILLCETVPRIQEWNLFILATDISDEALRTAEQGEYREWSFRESPPGFRERYFTRTEGGHKINPDIRRMVTFRHLNLVEDTYPLASTGTNFMDLILCRNVMIYFKPEVNAVITRRFHRALNQGGCLLVGHAEHTEQIFRGFGRELRGGTVVYCREEQWTDWDRGLRLRFRGSGDLPPNVVPVRPRPAGAPSPPPPGAHGRTREAEAFEEAVVALGAKDVSSAQQHLREVVKINPRNHRALYLLALTEANRNHLKRAADHCRRAIEAFPLSLEAHYLLAVIAREEGDRGAELDNLKKVVYINREFVLGHFQLGSYYLKEGNLQLSRRFFNNALRILERWESGDFIEGTEGMTVGRLRESIARELEELERVVLPPLEN